MTNSNNNLPPGVNSNMLPGNTPADVELEQFIDWLSNELVKRPTVSIPALRLLIETYFSILYRREVRQPKYSVRSAVTRVKRFIQNIRSKHR